MRWNLGVGCVETTLASGLTYFVWLFMSQSQGLIQILREVGWLVPIKSRAELLARRGLLMASRVGKGHRDSATAAVAKARGEGQERSPDAAPEQR